MAGGKDLGLGRLRRQGIRVVGRLSHIDRNKVGFTGCETAEVDAVIWATGYKDDSRWVAIPEVKDSRGEFVHWRGVSQVPGLYFIGRSWQWTRGSALLGGVGDDAAYVVSRITEQLSGEIAEQNGAASRGGEVASATESLGHRA